jgi:hypothetical protein
MEGALKVGNQMEKQRLDFFWRRAGSGVYYCAVCFDPNYRTLDAATVLSTSETSL